MPTRHARRLDLVLVVSIMSLSLLGEKPKFPHSSLIAFVFSLLSGHLPNFEVTQSATPFALRNFGCTGAEATFFDCPFEANAAEGTPSTGCRKDADPVLNEDVGVVCQCA